jgi:hypothetical protein
MKRKMECDENKDIVVRKVNGAWEQHCLVSINSLWDVANETMVDR